MARNPESIIVGLFILIIAFPILIELFSQIWQAFTPVFGALFSFALILFIIFAILEKLRIWR